MATNERAKTLELFNVKARHLQSSGFSDHIFGNPVGIRISGVRDQAVQIQEEVPAEESVEALALTIRMFIQDNERISIGNVARMYESLPVRRRLKDNFAQASAELNRFLDSGIPVEVNGERPTHREVLETYLYGGYAHLSERHRPTFERWSSSPLVAQFLHSQFVSVLGIIVIAVDYMRQINEKTLSEMQ